MTAVEEAAGGERFIDLHSHSVASDGALVPSAVVRAAHDAGLEAIALTDHDTIGGVAEALATGAELGVRVIPGCELSAYDGDIEVHLLALHIRDEDALSASLALFQRERIDRAIAMVERLARLGVRVSMDDVMREADGGAVGRPHVARALVRAGHVPDQRDAFDRYLGNGRPAYVPKPRLAAGDAIDLAHSAGALAVWAHPARLGTRERVARLASHGLDGIEVLHPSHTPQEVQRYARFAAELALVPSGGSDWHGATDGFRTLGCMHVPAEWLTRQDERLAARAA